MVHILYFLYSSESYSAENSEDPFLAYMNKVHDECGEEVLAFFKDGETAYILA